MIDKHSQYSAALTHTHYPSQVSLATISYKPALIDDSYDTGSTIHKHIDICSVTT